MARKIFTVSLALALALAGMAFAGGQNEPSAIGPGNGPGAQAPGGQKIVVTGSVSINNLIHPTMKSGDKVYELMVPRSLVYRSGVKEGAQVTVEGYLVQGMPMWQQGDDKNLDLFVTKATIDGKAYDLSQYRGGMAGAYGGGPRRGWAGGRGCGFGGGPMMGGWGYGEF